MKTEQRGRKSKQIRCWVVTRECLSKGRHYEFVLCLLPSRFRLERVAHVVLSLHNTLGSDFFGKHSFAASNRKRRERNLHSRYDYVYINDNPSTHAVLAEDAIVERGDSEFDQIITWTDPDIYEFKPHTKPVKQFDGKRRRHRVRFLSSCNTPNKLMTWGLPRPMA